MVNLKEKIVILSLAILALQFTVNNMAGFAAEHQDVVINEISWMGTMASSNDEWIELYNNSNQDIDLTGWTIVDDGVDTLIESGVIGAKSYFVIADSAEVFSNFDADLLMPLSLSNTGDSLVLKDSSGAEIDSVNTDGDMWAAGDNTDKLSMERISPLIDGTDDSNWSTSASVSSYLDRDGALINASPRAQNSSFVSDNFNLSLSSNVSTFSQGDFITVDILVSDAEDMFAYGFDIIYDENIFSYVSAEEGDFLQQDSVTTSFFSALENDQAGKIVLSSARIMDSPVGKSGDGILATLEFQVLENLVDASEISFATNSFIEDSISEQTANFSDLVFNSAPDTVESVSDFSLSEGDEYFSLKLTWSELADADSYVIFRENPDASLLYLGETSELSFIDDYNIASMQEYSYSIVAYQGSIGSQAVYVSGMDTRALKGDINKDGRVDGRDVVVMARHYAKDFSEENYYLLADLNYDATIDGQDLIELAVDFAKTY